jgi:2-hydroxychromene-2-carboxylate isomerase
MTRAPIDFYFDFSSPYGYLASERIDELAARHGRSVDWHPILLGVIFKTTGGAPLPAIPLKGEYSKRDFARTAVMLGVPFRLPERFPIAGQVPARAVLWAKERDAATAKDLAHALYRAYFAEGRDISQPEVVVAVAEALGLDAGRLHDALGEAFIKERLKTEVDAAMQRGVFGSPFFILDGEPFWGVDRMPVLERWLETGGWKY